MRVDNHIRSLSVTFHDYYFLARFPGSFHLNVYCDFHSLTKCLVFACGFRACKSVRIGRVGEDPGNEVGMMQQICLSGNRRTHVTSLTGNHVISLGGELVSF